MNRLPTGLYDLLHTSQLQKRLQESGLLSRAVWSNIEPQELPVRLAIPLAREIAGYLAEILAGEKNEPCEQEITKALCAPDALHDILEALQPLSAQVLHQIKPAAPLEGPKMRPDTPLSLSALLTGSSRSPSLRTQLIKELATCDRADWLVSFIKYAGILPLIPTLREFTQTPGPDDGPRLRIATTSYMGATDLKAIETLLNLPNTEVRISYDTKRTRLHAKAYIFHRATGFGSAYVGSANISKAALDEGLEWTAKISQYETDHLWRHAIATFESHWEDDTEFTPCFCENLPTLGRALSQERGNPQNVDEMFIFDLRPYGYQQAILEDIVAEREAGKNKHLVIAATGTGKTLMAAFDYKHYCAQKGGFPRLLFVAHREEILKQARAAFRQVLRDGSFGEIAVGGSIPAQMNHLFCTVQSWNGRNYDRLSPEHFDYVVLDEAHHATANSYQKLIDHIRPRSLLGLTATPERTDGGDVRQDFGGAFTHEMRLPEAIDRALLSPFHYYGIPDLDGLDFSSITWKRGGYDIGQLSQQLDGNVARAQWVVSQIYRYIADIGNIRGLGFCVSIAHAKFMAEYCNSNGIPAIALSGESSRDVRQKVQRQLENREIRFIFTVDLYNEGVDIPCVDTILFLRPTESLTLFLQQLGRGLRLHEEKSHLTVLDFIAPQNRQFNFAKRFQALSSKPAIRIDKQINDEMPYVPSGCVIHLEKQAKEYVFDNIRAAASRLRGQRMINELRQLRSQVAGDISLQQMLDYLHLDDPDEIYARGLPYQLMTDVEDGHTADDTVLFDKPLAEGFRRVALLDDSNLIEDAKSLIMTGTSRSELTGPLIHSLLWRSKKPENASLEVAHRFLMSRQGLTKDLTELLDWLLAHRTPMPLKQFPNLTGPLNLHASYSREQVLLAVGLGTFDAPRSSREGVISVPDRKLDVFFADINKSEADYSPTTMYEDYAITERLFHWQSQSTIGEHTETGMRYIHHQRHGYTPLLFIRERKKLPNGLTTPYLFAGPLKYRRHEGSRPMSIEWELDHPLPARALVWARRTA